MHLNYMHPVPSENQFHFTRLYNEGKTLPVSSSVFQKKKKIESSDLPYEAIHHYEALEVNSVNHQELSKVTQKIRTVTCRY